MPVIWWSAVLLFCLTGPIVKLPSAFAGSVIELNGGFILFLVYAGYYISLGDYVVAAAYDAFLFFLYTIAVSVARENSTGYVLGVFAVSQALGWGMQVIVGHNLIEKRKAALLDSLWDALFMAPIFTFYEMLFALGFRDSFARALQAKVNERIRLMDAGKTAASSSSSSSSASAGNSTKSSRKSGKGRA